VVKYKTKKKKKESTSFPQKYQLKTMVIRRSARQAAQKKQIVDISDGDDDDILIPVKKA
jgi:hypothetical protein